MLKDLRKKIKAKGTLQEYATDIGIRRATLSEFLSGKTDIRLSTLQKIVEPLGIDVFDKIPSNLTEVQTVFLEGGSYKKGQEYKGKEIVLCFGSASTSHQAFLLKGKDGKTEIEVI